MRLRRARSEHAKRWEAALKADREQLTPPATDQTTARASPSAPAAEPAPESIGALHAFRYRNFRILWVGNAFSAIAMWVQQTTVGYVVFDLTGSGSILGLTNGVRIIPAVLGTPLAGVAVDRLNHKAIMLASQLVLVLSTLGIAVALAFHHLAIWHLFAFSILGAMAGAFNQPVRQTVTFDVVPRRAVPNALALANLGGSIMRVVGPAAGGVLLAAIGASGNFFIQTAAFAIAAATVLWLVLPARRKDTLTRRSMFGDMWEGVVFITKDRRMLALFIIGLMPPIFLWPYWNALMPIYAKNALHTEAVGLGILLSSIGAGGILGAIVLASLNRFERRGLMYAFGLLGYAVSMLGLAFSHSMYQAVACLFFGGFMEPFYLITGQTLIQLMASDNMRGRTVSLTQLPMYIFPLGILVGGVLADLAGIRPVMIVAASIGIGFSLLFLATASEVRRLRLSDLAPRSP